MLTKSRVLESDLQKKFVFNVSRLIGYIYDHKYTCTFGEAYRTPEQAAIYAKEGKGIFDSQHCKRLAIDLHLFDAAGKYLTDVEDYKQFGQYWKSLDPKNRWGGDFHLLDGNHFEADDK